MRLLLEILEIVLCTDRMFAADWAIRIENDYSFSWFQGYTRDDEYVAAQGPLPFTVDDFWRMIWEHRMPIIVMLTLPKEGFKVSGSFFSDWLPTDCMEEGEE